MSLTKSDLHHVLAALETAIAEFNELINEKEWYVSDVVDYLASARQIIKGELNERTTQRFQIQQDD
jgi:hypothetical protein